MTVNHHIVVIDDSPLAVVDVSKPLASDEVEVEVEVERRATDLDTYISQQRSIDGIVGESQVWLADPRCRYQERA